MLRQKKKKLSEITDEKSFREDVLRVLFQKMGFKGVEVLHGPTEHGKDLVFYEINQLTEKKFHHAVVAKVGKITGGTSSATEHLQNIKRQIKLCLEIPYKDTTEKQSSYISKVWVINNSTISDNAKTQIIEAFGDQKGLVERYVEFISESKLIEWLDTYWPDFFKSGDPFILEYCNLLRERYEKLIELKTIGYQQEVKDLLDVFIEPKLVEEKREPSGKKKLAEFINHSPSDIIIDTKNYWITGTLGSGKSTLLRMQILNLIKEIERNLSKYTIPIAFRFKDLIVDDHIVNIDDLILSTIHSHNVFKHTIDPATWLKEGKVILFLDGYDEINTHKLSEQTLDAVNDFIDKYPTVKVIATSREKGIEIIESKLIKFHTIEIHPLSYKQMIQFITRWFSEREVERKAMQDVIKKTILANKLPKTPMVLTLLAIIVDERETKELPANLTELYSMFTQLYLGRWDSARDITNIFEYNIKSNILMAIASWMHEDGRDKVSEDAIKHYINDYATQRGIDINSTSLLNELIHRSHLLYKDDNNNYSFKHISFQQYFTSLRWEQKTYSTKDVLKYALDTWWATVVFFFVGKKKDAPDIIKGLIDLKTKDIYEEYDKILTLGQLLQAAYLTNLNMKQDALTFAINSYCEHFPDVLKNIKQSSKGHKMTEFFLVLILKGLFEEHYASATLTKAMKEVYEKTKASSNMADKTSFMKLYILAYVLAILDDKYYLEELATSPSQYDPIFSFLMDLDIAMLDKDYGIKITEESIKKLKKRIKKNSRYIKTLLGG